MKKISVFDLLGILFLTLKLTHVIDWSWWLVLAPWLVWIPLAMLAMSLHLFRRYVLMDKQGRARDDAAKALREYGEALSRRR